MLILEPRKSIPPILRVLVPLIAILITIVFGGIIFGILGYNPLKALYVFFISPLSRADQIADLFVKACPLIIIGTGLVFCFRANVWNIGAEGQLILGALVSGGVALFFNDIESKWLLLLMGIGGFLGGALWALIPGILKVKFRTNEILVSLMLTYVASLLIDWLVRGPWRDPKSFGFPLSKSFSDGGIIPPVILPNIGKLGQLHWGVLFSIFIAILGWYIYSKTLAGFQVKVFGSAPKAAKFSGFNPNIITIFVLFFGGGLAGLAGMIEVSANIGQLQPNISFGYGFTAIIVAFLARLNPLSVIIAALVVALAELGGDSAQIYMSIPKVVTGLFKGLLLFTLLAGETWTNYKISFDFKFLKIFSGNSNV